MNCDEMNIHCFFTELEKLKAKIDGHEDKIDWTGLSREFLLREEILDYYKDRVDWEVISKRLWDYDCKLFTKYYDEKMFDDFANFGTGGNFDCVLKYFDKLDAEKVSLRSVYTSQYLEVYKLMIASPKWDSETLINMAFSYVELNEILTDTFKEEEIVEVFLNRLDVDIATNTPYLENWLDNPALMAVIDLNNLKHRNFVLQNLNARTFKEHFESKYKFSYNRLYNRYAPRLKRFAKLRHFFGLSIIKVN